MPLHENLERKRRQNIVALKQSGACHLCECTSSRSYRRFIGNDEDVNQLEEHHEHQQQQQEDTPPMRTCMCYGNPTTHGAFPLKVCEMCITDDATTGRVRCCSLCGVVACDENGKCGVELVEATDRDSFDNAGCLECRGMESFSEMALFRRRPYPNGIPRATRCCTNCLELFSLFSFGTNWHFTCSKFKCNNLLVPSHIVELKRFLSPFPLSLLPTEMLDVIVDFLGAKDLFNCGLTCTTMFRKVEKISKEIVLSSNHVMPTGPVQLITTNNRNNVKKVVVQAEGKHNFGLRPPEDAKTWVAVVNQLDQLAKNIFYFDFQTMAGDEGAPMRYLRSRNRLVFDRVYSKPPGSDSQIVPFYDTSGLMVRGGQALVTRFRWHHSFLEDREDRHDIRSIIFSTDRQLAPSSGIHHAIIRYYCFCESDSLGSIGILRRPTDGSAVTWAQQHIIAPHARMEEHVFGIEYDANQRKVLFYKRNARTNTMESTTDGEARTICIGMGNNLFFAASLTSASSGIRGNQLSIRSCDEEEWGAFLAHTPERNVIPGIRGRGRRGDERLLRYLDHRARRAMAGRGGEDLQDLQARAEIEHMIDDLRAEEMERIAAADDDDIDDDFGLESDADDDDDDAVQNMHMGDDRNRPPRAAAALPNRALDDFGNDLMGRGHW